MQIFIVSLAAAAAMPEYLVQQYVDSAYSPVITSSLAGVSIPSSGVLNAAIIRRNKRQVLGTTTSYINPQTSTAFQTL